MSDDFKTPHGEKRNEVQIKAGESELFGAYSNQTQITHTPEEITLNFLYLVPNSPIGKLVSSVILSPAHAKRLLIALGENLSLYEQKYGEIKLHPRSSEPKIGIVQ